MKPTDENPNSTLTYTGEWYTSVPDSLLQNNDLTGQAKLLWICIKSFASPKSPCPFPGYKTLCRMLGGCSRQSFWRFKKELIEQNWLECHQEHGTNGSFGSCVYAIKVPNNQDKQPGNKKPCIKNMSAGKSVTKEYPISTEGVPRGEEEPPEIGGEEALKACQERRPDLPFRSRVEATMKRAKEEMDRLWCGYALENSITGTTWKSRKAKTQWEAWKRILKEANERLVTGQFIE